jgi:hypothetical protein
MDSISTCELDIKEIIIKEKEENEHFKSVKAYLEQEPNGPKYNGYQLLENNLLT